jgi:hypothetical protein
MGGLFVVFGVASENKGRCTLAKIIFVIIDEYDLRGQQYSFENASQGTR